jgi:ribulose-5-phosphate 4-epimerase/fuculose-1-phosphate aldolase
MCVIHTHSMNAQLATMLDPTEEADSIKITHLEMLKGVGHHAYDDVLEVPIIDNRPTEDQLADQLEEAVLKYPKCNAVLVRRHGSKMYSFVVF